MFSEDEIARAQSRIPLHDLVGRDVALKPAGREFAGLCPFHNEKTPSFYVVPEKGMFHCFGCGAHGNAIVYVMRQQHLGFVAAVQRLLDLPETAYVRHYSASSSAKRATEGRDLARVYAILRECGPLSERTAAHLYLWTRGLSTHQPALRAHPSLYVAETSERLPALVASIKDSAGHVVACLRIWCLPRVDSDARDSRAPLDARKKILGALGDGCARLAAAGSILGLAEGVETAIGAMDLYRLPVWATCGLARLGYPAHWSEPKDGHHPIWIPERPPSIWIPPEVRQIVIFGDNGQIGHTVAEFAADWWQRQGYSTEVVFPDERFSDHADAARAKAYGTAA